MIAQWILKVWIEFMLALILLCVMFVIWLEGSCLCYGKALMVNDCLWWFMWNGYYREFVVWLGASVYVLWKKVTCWCFSYPKVYPSLYNLHLIHDPTTHACIHCFITIISLNIHNQIHITRSQCMIFTLEKKMRFSG